MTNTPTDMHPIMISSARSMDRFCNSPTPENEIIARKEWALIDWIEPEIDPDSDSGAFLEVLFQLGKAKGFRTVDEMTEDQFRELGMHDWI